MAKTTIGYSPCPECGSIQAVESDGLKYLIHCTDCKTFTHYQNKVAKNRIVNKLLPDVSDELEVIEAEQQPVTQPIETTTSQPEMQPEAKPKTEPDQPAPPRNLIDVLAQYF